jgi:hypothetical protein
LKGGYVGRRLAKSRPGTREAIMDVKIGTFNLNNLFSRFNFRAEVEDASWTVLRSES